ncbi:hypothetical protein GHT07_09445 [Caenimonas koreensis DSM 17982]|uniref:DUF4124 domain-containing protein n=1 Tax=Caenimonas koreensis DSM 17982 TaxID=1121255 RepID=A0A844BAD9_9BURK|nr:hypothetical protein [Caenimonas koreensis]MRD47501.1 hypothetical protein [Caenimonas koreensis DSM 17982]
MKHYLLIPLTLAAMATASHAQTIYRCVGNVYTNDAAEAKAKGCKIMEGGNITIVQGTRANSGNAPSGANGVKVATASEKSPYSPNARIDDNDQRARDSEARSILEAELKKAEARQSELVKEYNNGEPEMLGPEHRNRQKYIDRIAELKASMTRNESDIAGIRRELSRVK